MAVGVGCCPERKPPFSPNDVVLEFAALLKTYRVRTISGDRYGGEWPRERFRIVGIAYDLSNRSKSDLYRDMLPLLNSGKVELLDHPRLVSQLCGLERRTARGGRIPSTTRPASTTTSPMPLPALFLLHLTTR